MGWASVQIHSAATKSFINIYFKFMDTFLKILSLIEKIYKPISNFFKKLVFIKITNPEKSNIIKISNLCSHKITIRNIIIKNLVEEDYKIHI